MAQALLRKARNMNIGAYQGASALAAYEKWQEVISQNIAFGSAPGFKKEDISFDQINGGSTKLNQQGNLTDNINGVMPSVSTRINFSQGTLQHSENQLDFAIQGNGFFQIKRPNGQLAYTRDGEFHLSANRMLVTNRGGVVMGSAGPITFGDNGGNVKVNADGTISQGADQVGKLVVYDFKDTKALQHAGDGLFAPGDGSAQPKLVDKPQVLNGFLETSNVSPLTEMVNLINVSRAYEASQKVITSGDDGEDKAIQSLGSPPE